VDYFLSTINGPVREFEVFDRAYDVNAEKVLRKKRRTSAHAIQHSSPKKDGEASDEELPEKLHS
jgi:hypothetical protein